MYLQLFYKKGNQIKDCHQRSSKMKIFQLFTLLFIFHLVACNAPIENKPISKAFLSVPKLLDRPEKLWQGKEWESIQNNYGNARKSLQDRPEDLIAYLKLAEVFIHEARVTGEHGHYYPAALKVLNAVLEKEAQQSDLNFQALSLKASVLLSQHEFQQALVIAQQALRLNQHNAQIYGILVDAHVELGDYKKAVLMADQMVSIRPDLRSYSRISYLREIHGDTNGAIEAMKLALAAAYPGQEQSAWIKLRLAKLYVSTGKLAAAEFQYNQLLSERENYPFAIAAKAEIAVKRKEYKKAEELLLQACDIIPEVGFFEQLAALYQELGQDEKLNTMLPKILTMLEEDAQSGHNTNLERANFHLEFTKDYDKALSYALAEYEKRPNNIDINKTLSFIYFEKQDFDKAKQHLDKASRTKSKKADLLCLQALLAIAQGNKSWGIQQLKIAFKNNPYQSHCLVQQSKKALG